MQISWEFLNVGWLQGWYADGLQDLCRMHSYLRLFGLHYSISILSIILYYMLLFLRVFRIMDILHGPRVNIYKENTLD